MTALDACRRCELTSFNSHKDLMGLIVTPSLRQTARGSAGGGGEVWGGGGVKSCSGDGRGVIVLAGCGSPPGRDDCTVQICKPGETERWFACTLSLPY